jgi:hypothetical protein
MQINPMLILKQLFGIKTKSANAFQERISHKDYPMDDRRQWNGGRYLSAAELRDCRDKNEGFLQRIKS